MLALIALGIWLGLADNSFAEPAINSEWQLDPGRVGWTHIGLKATKFFLTASTEVRVSVAETPCMAFLSPDQGTPVLAGPDTAVLTIDSEGLGIRSTATLWMDAQSGAALQYSVLDQGRRHRQRSYRYTDTGAFHWTRHPDRGEEDAAAETWSKTESGMRDYPPTASGERIIDPIGLLYIISASDMSQPGDTIELVVYARRRIARLTITADRFVSFDDAIKGNDFARTLTAGRHPKEALLFRLTPRAMSANDDMEFDFLGLSRDIEILLDPNTRLPLRISGKARIVGKLSIELQAATLKSEPGTANTAGCPVDQEPTVH